MVCARGVTLLVRLACALSLTFALPVVASAEQAPVYPEYNGFEKLSDGRYLLSFGYYSLNREPVTITAGPDNLFVPGEVDRRQPITFQPGHHRYACTMIVATPASAPPRWTIRYGAVTTTTTSNVFEPIYTLADDGAPFAKEGLDPSKATVGACVSPAPALATAPVATSDAAVPTPTFTRDVLPILQRACQNCHRPGQVAPFSLMTYESARPWARAIKTNVVSRYMPPWHIDRHVGQYMDDPSLSDREISIVSEWVDAGAPRGNPADAPAERQFLAADVWVFGEEPDVVVTAPAVRVEAEGADTYPELETATGLTEHRYIKWMQVVPEHPEALHHTMVYANQANSAAGPLLGIDAPRIAGALPNGMQSTLLVLFAGGGAAGLQFPEGQGKLLEAGARLRFAHHFHTTGEALSERTKIAFKFFPRGYTPTHLISTIAIGNRPRPTLAIPPGDPNARGDGYFLLQKAARIVSFQPHMHYRGKRMLLEAILPDGESVLLTDADRFRWTWQLTYRYKTPPAFPAGTVLHITSYHDNSAGNRDNPDPTAFVSWGERTVDEMNNGWVDFYYISADEYAAYTQR